MNAVRRALRLVRTPLDRLVVAMTPACERIVREASGQLDGVQLTRWQRYYIQVHLMCCTVCDDYIRNIRILGQALRRLAGGDAGAGETRDEDPASAGPGLSDQARERLIAHLKEHHGPSTGGP